MFRWIFTALIITLLVEVLRRHFRRDSGNDSALDRLRTEEPALRLASLKEFYLQSETAWKPDAWIEAMTHYMRDRECTFDPAPFLTLLEQRNKLEKTNDGELLLRLEKDRRLFLEEARLLDKLIPPEKTAVMAGKHKEILPLFKRLYHPDSIRKELEKLHDFSPKIPKELVKKLQESFEVLQKTLDSTDPDTSAIKFSRAEEEKWFHLVDSGIKRSFNE